MAKLLIYRGETLHDERPLPARTVTIGRGSQNDIVLEDPGKGVSRVHAELRFEGGRYTLFDRDSQNGIWVAAQRLASVVLGPDVIAAVGPYRLRLEEEVPAPVTPPVDVAPVTDPPLPVASPAPLELDDIAPSAADVPAPPPIVTKSQASQGQQVKPRVPLWLGSAAAASLIVVVAVAAYKIWPSGPPPPVWNAVAARDLVAQGRCDEAMAAHILPALNADPKNQEALALRDACTPPTSTIPPTSSSVPPTPSVDDHLNEAETLLGAKECQKALDVVAGVLASDAGNVRATELAAKAKACLAPPPPPVVVAAEKLAVTIPPEQGGLEPLPKETDKAYQLRIAAMRDRYDEAVALLGSQRFPQAARLFDDIAMQVPAGYLELAQRREDARAGLRIEAKKAFDGAQAADKRGDFDTAADLYRRAASFDPGLQAQVEAAVQGMTERRIALGKKRCDEGKVAFSLGYNADAIAAFQDAVRLLPQSDPCYALARQRLQQLGK